MIAYACILTTLLLVALFCAPGSVMQGLVAGLAMLFLLFLFIGRIFVK